jgi:exodeoxyribonuclease V beta subunit
MDEFPGLLPSIKNYQHRKIMLKSFSSLHDKIFHGLDHMPPDIGFRAAQAKDKEDDESLAAFAADKIHAASGAEDEIPGGTDTGSMLHDIIEHIDFKAVVKNPDSLLQTPETRDVIVKYMEMYRLHERWRPQVCRVVANALTTPIRVAGDEFRLGDLKPADRIHEVEFYYPFALPVDKELKVPDCKIAKGPNGFIRGFVDLVFWHKQKFFIADWKSNRVDTGYDRNALQAYMNYAGYHLQYKLYTIAVLRWLKQALGNRFDPDRQFGGIFYFYLRGMGCGNGIYYIAPGEVGRLEQLEAEIADKIAGGNIPVML